MGGGLPALPVGCRPGARDVRAMVRTLWVWSALAVGSAACSTGYVPRTPGRIAVTLDGGQYAYVRDGQRHRHGLFGGGLVDAVRGVPAAEAAADEYHDRMRDGFLVGIGGLLCSGVAFGVAVGQSLDDQPDRHASTAAWVALGCAVAMGGGFIYMASAEPYRWDAINIFNDTMEARGTAPFAPPPFAPAPLPSAPGSGGPPGGVDLRLHGE